MTWRRSTLLATAVLVGFASGGCSGGDGDLDRAEMEAAIATQLAAEVGADEEPDIDCPEPIEAEVGATGTCHLQVDGEEARYEVAVEVTAIEDERASYSIEVADAPVG